MTKIDIKDPSGVDYGYKFVKKCTAYEQITVSGPARSAGGNLWIWGDNGYGQLGVNSNACVRPAGSPVQTVAGGNNWKQVEITGEEFTFGAIKTDGTLWTWGNGIYGLLGNSSTIRRSSPVQTTSGGTNWKCLTAGIKTFSALKTDGTLWSWGNGCGGARGDCGSGNASCPVQVSSGGVGWSRVAMSSACGGVGIRCDGTMWWWGGCVSGYFYSNTCIPGSGCGWRDVAMSGSSIAGIKIDGTLWSLGCTNGISNPYVNFRGRLSSPVQEATFSTNWKSVTGPRFGPFNFNNTSLGFSAIKCDSTLWGWAGTIRTVLIPTTLGTTSTFSECEKRNTYKPVLNITGYSKWRQTAIFCDSGLGVKQDGSLWQWGVTSGTEATEPSGTQTGLCLVTYSPVQLFPNKVGWKHITTKGRYNAAGII